MSDDIAVIIPARSGSKGIKDKNIIDYKGKPLIFWTIEQALKLKEMGKINKIFVSTDSQNYENIIRSNDEFDEVNIIYRPYNISQDNSLDIECFSHALEVLNMANYYPDVLLHLRPTYPNRKVEDVLKAINIFLKTPDASSLRSVVRNKKSVFKSYFIRTDGFIEPCIQDEYEFNNAPRQMLRPDFQHNGCIDIVRAGIVFDGSMSGTKILPYLMKEIKDIDTIEDLENISFFSEIPKRKTFCFDIDGIICTNNIDYKKAVKIQSTVDLINKLYENKNTIILFTARGSVIPLDWGKLTIEQLEKWGVKYHELRFKKPAADYYIDDKYININKLKKEIDKFD